MEASRARVAKCARIGRRWTFSPAEDGRTQEEMMSSKQCVKYSLWKRKTRLPCDYGGSGRRRGDRAAMRRWHHIGD